MSPQEEKAEACKALLREKLSVLLKAEKPHPVVTLQQSVSVEQALSASSVWPFQNRSIFDAYSNRNSRHPACGATPSGNCMAALCHAHGTEEQICCAADSRLAEDSVGAGAVR